MECITHAVNAVSGEGRRPDEVKNKWFDLKSKAKKHLKHRRQTLATGWWKAGPELPELDQRIGALIGQTSLTGVPSAEDLDTDLGPVSAVSSPTPELEGKRCFCFSRIDTC